MITCVNDSVSNHHDGCYKSFKIKVIYKISDYLPNKSGNSVQSFYEYLRGNNILIFFIKCLKNANDRLRVNDQASSKDLSVIA